MRGKGVRRGKWQNAYRITPAYAGKSVFAYLCSAATEDHPRLCGEKEGSMSSFRLNSGSPPPMRGKARHWQAILMHRRITPAYAGKSISINQVTKNVQDHPRLCGEKVISVANCQKPLGSPPPMRGKEAAPPKVLVCGRITPAYAGKRTISSQEWYSS